MIGLALRGLSFHCNWLTIYARHSQTIRDPSCLRFPAHFPLTASCFGSMISSFHFLACSLVFIIEWLITWLTNWLIDYCSWLIDWFVWWLVGRVFARAWANDTLTRVIIIDWSMTLLVSALQEIAPWFIWRTPKRKLPDNSWRRSWCFRGYPQLL